MNMTSNFYNVFPMKLKNKKGQMLQEGKPFQHERFISFLFLIRKENRN